MAADRYAIAAECALMSIRQIRSCQPGGTFWGRFGAELRPELMLHARRQPGRCPEEGSEDGGGGTGVPEGRSTAPPALPQRAVHPGPASPRARGSAKPAGVQRCAVAPCAPQQHLNTTTATAAAAALFA